MKYSVSFLPDPFPAKGLVSFSCHRAGIQRACIPFLPKGLYPKGLYPFPAKGLVSLSCQRACIPFPAKGFVFLMCLPSNNGLKGTQQLKSLFPEPGSACECLQG